MMFDTISFALRTILPILLVILLGYVASRLGPWPEDFFKTLNGLCFRLFLPIHLFCNIYALQDLASVNWRVIGYLLGGILFSLLVGVAVSRLFIRERRQKGVITQAAFRSNQAILGVPLASALGGEESLAMASLATSLFVPLFNVLAVVVLTEYSGEEGKKCSLRSLVRRVVTNPLIIGCAAGILVVVVRQFLPTMDGATVFTIQNQLPSLYKALNNISKVASPVMLFVLGARLNFSSVPGIMSQLCLGVLCRLVVCPLFVVGGSLLLRKRLGLTATELATVIAVSSTPVAVSSAVMVQEIGGDDQLANQIVVWTSVLSMLTVFCIISLMRFMGFL